MRVTGTMLANTAITNIMKKSERLLHVNRAIATGKRIHAPSDDPAATSEIMGYRTLLSSIEQYEKNIAGGKMRLEVSDNALDRVMDLLAQARNLAVEHSAGNMESRASAAADMEAIYDQVLQMANTRLGDGYLFSGHGSDAPAFSEDGSYNGDDGELYLLVGAQVRVKINTNGDEVFTGEAHSDGVDVFEALKGLKNALENKDMDGNPLTEAEAAEHMAALIDPLQKAEKQVQDAMAQGAAAYQRLKATETYWAGFKVKMEDLVGRVEGADMAEAALELKNQELTYEATLSASARILQTSLMNYLR